MGEGNASASRGKEEGKKKKSYGGKPERRGKGRRGECKREEMRCPALEPEVTQYPGTVCCQKKMVVVVEVAGDKQLRDQVVPQNW